MQKQLVCVPAHVHTNSLHKHVHAQRQLVQKRGVLLYQLQVSHRVVAFLQL
jgi:hypothetical protein